MTKAVDLQCGAMLRVAFGLAGRQDERLLLTRVTKSAAAPFTQCASRRYRLHPCAEPSAGATKSRADISSEGEPCGADMDDAGITRKLAVILAADVAGYARLMAADEEGTLAALNARRQVIDELIARHRGRIFTTAGDSVMSEFASAVEAVRCAAAIQREIARRNADLPEPRRSSGVVEDDAERVAVAGAQPADAVAQVDAVDAARALHRPVVHRRRPRRRPGAAARPRRATACAAAARSARTRRR